MDVRQRAWIVWAAMVASVVTYAAVILAVRLSEPARSPTALTPALALAALASGAGSLALRAWLLVRPARAGRLDLAREPDARRFFAVSVACWALAEAVAVLGLVTFLVQRAPGVGLGCVVGSLALLALQAPRLAPLRPPPTSQDLARRPGPI
jgi:hypothetical protein